MSFAYLPVNIGSFLGPALGSLITRSSVFAIFPAAAIFTALGVVLLVNPIGLHAGPHCFASFSKHAYFNAYQYAGKGHLRYDEM